jgi:hypothetical protein
LPVLSGKDQLDVAAYLGKLNPAVGVHVRTRHGGSLYSFGTLPDLGYSGLVDRIIRGVLWCLTPLFWLWDKLAERERKAWETRTREGHSQKRQ